MRKKLFNSIIAIFVLLFFASGIYAQGFENIASAFKTGNASELASHFDNNVEITIKTGANSYSKSQGEMVLKNFFAQHTPKAFTIAHQGTSPEGSKSFIIGNLSTAVNNFRVYVYAKAVNKVLVIQEIRIEDPQ